MQGSTLLQEMDCYGLPYGGLGFLSHFLTFYSIACLWFARKSLWPFRPVKYGKFDFVLGLVGFLVSTAMTIRTMVNCHHAWQFVLIAIGNLSMSALSGVTAITVCSLIISNPKEESKLTRFGTLWMFFRKSYKFEIPSISVNNLMNYFCCRSPLMIIGLVGLGSVISAVAFYPPVYHPLTKLIAGFFVTIGILVLFSLLQISIGSTKVFAITGLFVIVSLTTFFGDWALGLILDNMSGAPSHDNAAVYWTYFVAKRLTLLSW